MRARNEAARDRLPTLLRRLGPVGTPHLARALGVSLPTAHRMLRELGAAVVVRAGRTDRARVALCRPIRGIPAPLPLYEIDPAGAATQVANLALIEPRGSCCPLPAVSWPLPDESVDGWWPGLPYPLYDMRAQGYLGRQLARAEAARLGVADDPSHWGDEEIAFVLAQCGADVSGNLILGDPALQTWLRTRIDGPAPIAGDAVGPAYTALADRAAAAGIPGSSAAGEFPKFAALRNLPGAATPHVLVKFTAGDRSPTTRRWADLLVCEHLALEILRDGAGPGGAGCDANAPGVPAAASRIVRHAGRTFLEVERFDRMGSSGRHPLCSLETANAALIGAASSDWVVLAERLSGARLLGLADVQRIARLWWYGRLIANTDMHLGNLSLRPGSSLASGVIAPSVSPRPGRTVAAAFTLAPAYDMLPMLYAPLPGGEVPERSFKPPLPVPSQHSAWIDASVAAVAFWERAADDPRVSAPFRRICSDNAECVRKVGETIGTVSRPTRPPAD